MKVKTSVTLSPGLLAAIDECANGRHRRSAILEELAWDTLRRRERDARDRRETELLNEIADGKFGEPSDVLEYSVPWYETGDDVEVIGDDETR